MSKHTLSVLVENKPGVLTRVAALFSRRGFNIDSLAVGPTEIQEISRMTVVVDSGFRRGNDVVKAVTLGADAVMIGRATLYGLIAGGEAGVQRALEILTGEIDRTLGHLGVRTLDELGPHVLRRAS